MRKLDRLLTWIYLICGGFTLVCFGAYFIKLFISPEGILPRIATMAVLIVVTVPFLLRRQLKKLLKRAYVPLKAVLCAGFLFYTVTFIALIAYIYNPSDISKPEDASGNSVYIVFGAKIHQDGRTSSVLRSRLDSALEALEANEDGICIVSGGKGFDEPVSESAVMMEYLISHGIDEERIIEEDSAHNTAENIRLSIKIMEGKGLEDCEIVCVSSDTHIPRVRLLCQREGIEAKYIAARYPKKAYLFPNLVREYLSYSRMLLVGY